MNNLPEISGSKSEPAHSDSIEPFSSSPDADGARSKDPIKGSSKASRWPHLEDLALGAEDLARRRHGIGGSDANIILSGDPDKILRLWKEKRGEIDAEDLSRILRVALGNWTEAFNRQWYQCISGNDVDRAGENIQCPTYNWRTCTIDGVVESAGAVWEAKHTSGFTSVEDLLGRYMPQLQHNMAVAGLSRAILSVIFGNHKYEIIEIASDWIYQLELLEAEQDFWNCVLSGRPPIAAEPPPSPRPVGIRELCLEGNNAWAAAAADWLQNRAAAKTHATACLIIKGMVEQDVSRAFGHGIEAKRSKSGAINVREFAL